MRTFLFPKKALLTENYSHYIERNYHQGNALS